MTSAGGKLLLALLLSARAALASDAVPPSAMLEAELESEFRVAAEAIRDLVNLRNDRFPELDFNEIEHASRLVRLRWRATEHIDLECPDERTDATETRRPFCLMADGRTAIVSSTYFASTRADEKERFALVAGVLLLVADVRGTSNRAIALRIGEAATEYGFKSDGGRTAGTIPNEDPLHGMRWNKVGFGGGVSKNRAHGWSPTTGPFIDLLHSGSGRGNPGDYTATLIASLRAGFGGAGDRLIYNLDLNVQLRAFPVLVGVWLVIKSNQFESHRETFFSPGVAVLSLPVQLGGEDYLLLRVNAGPALAYTPEILGKLAERYPNAKDLQFGGYNINADVLLKTGAFFINVRGDYGGLHNPDVQKDGAKKAPYTRVELVASIAAELGALYRDDMFSLELRHNSLSADGAAIPGIEFSNTSVGVNYGFSWR